MLSKSGFKLQTHREAPHVGAYCNTPLQRHGYSHLKVKTKMVVKKCATIPLLDRHLHGCRLAQAACLEFNGCFTLLVFCIDGKHGLPVGIGLLADG